mmetsp:Transcript_20736/g.31284  ORF Transcript_20736/g.31284 Transcript_20736/m.31284 type:complete len:247 (-) Transcript_20736:637-1377(-)
MLALKPHCSRFELVAKHYCWNTSAAAEQAAAVDSTVLADPFPFAVAALAAAYHQQASFAFVPGEVLAFVVPSALACLDDEVAAEEVEGAFLEHPFRKERLDACSSHDAKNYAWNHDDVEIDLWNGFDYGVAYIQSSYFCYDYCCNFGSSTCGVYGAYLYHHSSHTCCSFYHHHHGADFCYPYHLFRGENYHRFFRNERNADRLVQHAVDRASLVASDQIADFGASYSRPLFADSVSLHAYNGSRCP